MSITSLRVALRAGVVAVAGAAALTGSLLAASSVAAASPEHPAAAQDEFNPVQSSMMRPGDKLEPGEDVSSGNGQFTLRQQLDGNLVLFEKTGRVVWHAGTAPSPGAETRLNRRGNLVVKSAAGERLWTSGTEHEGATLHVQNDGNMTIRTQDGDVLWAVSEEISKRNEIRSGEVLQPGEERHSLTVNGERGKYTLRMQADGNLVLVEDTGRVVWHAGTAPSPGTSAHMLPSGNLVVKSAAGEQLWESGTHGDGVVTHVQNDGNMTIRTPDGDVLWAVSEQAGRR